jgi:Tol biopolymer transport system component
MFQRRGREKARGRRLLAVVITVISAVGVSTVSPAEAAFPGANGPIVYPCVPNASSNGDLCRLDPQTGAVTVIVDGMFPIRRERVGVSPDGSLVAYSQVFGIFVRRIDGSPIPGALSGPITFPGSGDVSFTPDGASIVYRYFTGLYRTPIPAGNPDTQIPGTVEGDRYPEVSPDGTTIAFVNGDTLFTIPLAGGARTPLVSGIVNDQVSWAPNGSRIAFVAGAGLCPVEGIATVPRTGGPVTCLPNGRGAAHPSFSPDGTLIFVGLNGDAAFIGANGVGRREVFGLGPVAGNNWAPGRASANPRCAALLRELDRTTDPRARAAIQRYLAAARC